MKIRAGFVSNSSSSSFIVASKSGPKVELSLTIDLSKYGYIAKSMKELDACFLKQTHEKNMEEVLKDPCYAERYNQCKKAIEKGEIVTMGNFGSDSDDPLEQFLCENGIDNLCNSNVKCIYNKGGY